MEPLFRSIPALHYGRLPATIPDWGGARSPIFRKYLWSELGTPLPEPWSLPDPDLFPSPVRGSTILPTGSWFVDCYPATCSATITSGRSLGSGDPALKERSIFSFLIGPRCCGMCDLYFHL